MPSVFDPTPPEDKQRPDDLLRIGTADREDALEELNSALAEGRISNEEYWRCSGRVAGAVTRADLREIFADPRLGSIEQRIEAREKVSDDSRNIRIGTNEREAALSFLSAQFSTGRISADEFAQRSAAVGAAVTRGDLDGVLGDLPAPPPITREGSLADAIDQHISEDNRKAADRARWQAAEQAAQQQANLSAANELAGLLIELAAYLATKVAPRRYELVGRPKWQHRGNGLVRNSWNQVKPLPMSEVGWLMRKSSVSDAEGRPLDPTVILVPDGRLWYSQHNWIDTTVPGWRRMRVQARYADLREELPKLDGITLRGFKFHSWDGALKAIEGETAGLIRGEQVADVDVRNAFARIAASIIADNGWGLALE